MRTKEEAAKLLLENGWTLEEVNEVLGQSKVEIVINPQPMFYQPVYIPQPEPEPFYQRWEITCEAVHIPTPYVPAISQQEADSAGFLADFSTARAMCQ